MIPIHRSSPMHCLARTYRALARDFPALTNERRQVAVVQRRRLRRDEAVDLVLSHKGSAWPVCSTQLLIRLSVGSSPAPPSLFVPAWPFVVSCSCPYPSCRLCLPWSDPLHD